MYKNQNNDDTEEPSLRIRETSAYKETKRFKEIDVKAIYDFAKKCLKLRSKFSLTTSTLTPVNFHEEKEKFLNSQTYNPQFMYKQHPYQSITKDLNKLRRQLDKLKLPDDLQKYFSDYIDNIHLVSQTFHAIGTDEFAIYTDRLFNLYIPSARTAMSILPQLDFSEEKKVKMHSAEEITRIFHNYMKNYEELQHYNIYLDSFNDHTIRVGEKKLIVGCKVKRNANNVKRLIVHEIESHILQRYNMRAAKNPLVKLIRTGEQEVLSEGLAVYNEIYTKTITHKAYNTYFYRLKAVEMLDYSFRDIFTYLTNFVTPHMAFIITGRVKRGMADTSRPGGYPKDASYLLGYEVIDNYMKKGGDLSFLYIVRHPEYGALLKKYNLLSDGDYLYPKFLKNIVTKNGKVKVKKN